VLDVYIYRTMLVLRGRDWRGGLVGGSEGHEASCAFGGDQITDGEGVTQIANRSKTVYKMY
jgi:hypothetical protein